jgi:hypothetical protein
MSEFINLVPITQLKIDKTKWFLTDEDSFNNSFKDMIYEKYFYNSKYKIIDTESYDYNYFELKYLEEINSLYLESTRILNHYGLDFFKNKDFMELFYFIYENINYLDESDCEDEEEEEYLSYNIDTKKKSPPKPKKHKKRSISPSRVHRKVTKKLKRSKKTKKPKNDKKCKCGSHKYTGNEETPRGLGKCEECLPFNVVLKGKDGKLYENRKEGWHKLN